MTCASSIQISEILGTGGVLGMKKFAEFKNNKAELWNSSELKELEILERVV